jgi:hypothetical protein
MTDIRTLLPKLTAAQAVHYAERDDLEFVERWVSYLRSHHRIPDTVRTTRLDALDPPRLVVVTVHNGGEQHEYLRVGQSLLLHEGQLAVLDTSTVIQRFVELTESLLPAPAGPSEGERPDGPTA